MPEPLGHILMIIGGGNGIRTRNLMLMRHPIFQLIYPALLVLGAGVEPAFMASKAIVLPS